MTLFWVTNIMKLRGNENFTLQNPRANAGVFKIAADSQIFICKLYFCDFRELILSQSAKIGQF
jgi:hypothetical protein